MNTASAWSPTLRDVHSYTAAASIRLVSWERSADAHETTSSPTARKYAAPWSFNTASNQGGWTRAMRPTPRVRSASTADAQVDETGRPTRCESVETRAASSSKPIPYAVLVDAKPIA